MGILFIAFSLLNDSFYDFNDAKEERDICVACGWDLDKIVEFGDSIEV